MYVKRERFLRFVLVYFIISMLAACNGLNSKPNPADEDGVVEDLPVTLEPDQLYELGKERLDISFYGHYTGYSMPQWGADSSSKWIMDNLNIHVKGISSSGNGKQKLQEMIASKELPDIIWGERGYDLERLREAGLLVPLDKYIDKYPNLKKWAGTQVLNLLRAEDENIYYFPNYYTNKPNGNAGYVVNKRIYRELGSPKLATTTDLYNYLTKVKEKYPDVVPFETGLATEGQGIDQLFSAFKEENYSFTRYYAVTSGDKMTSIYKDKGFRESAVFVAKLMREGLITSDAMTQTDDQVSEKLMSGKVAIFASADPMRQVLKANAELARNNPEDGYFYIDPIHKEGLDPEKIYPGTYTLLGWNVAAITTSAKNPEAIFAMLDWMTGPEGSAVQMWGPPGPEGYWDGFKDDGSTPNFTSRYTSDPEGLSDIQSISGEMIWVGNTVYLDETKNNYEMTLPEDKRNWSTYWQQKVTWKSQGNATPFINLTPTPNSDIGKIFQRVKEIWLSARSYALYGQSEEEVLMILDQAHKDSMEAGFQDYLEFISSKWQANLQLLNQE